MQKLFLSHHCTAENNLIPYASFHPFGDENFPADVSYPQAVKEAEALLDKKLEVLPASLYMEYQRNGNRSHYEAVYFQRRRELWSLLLAELTERKGRFADKLVDYIWAVCDESTWIIPAHNRPRLDGSQEPLPDCFSLGENDDVRNIDLFSACTGAEMAWVWYMAADLLDGITPVIRRRIRRLIEARIFHIYYNVVGETNWWMGDRGGMLNNWTPWIVSNVLTAVMLCEEDDRRREWAVNRSMEILDRFTEPYPADGGCDEGPSYWGAAGASYFDCLELLEDMSGGKITLWDDPLAKKMCEYIADFRIAGDTYVNFADSHYRLHRDSSILARMGKKFSSDKLTAMAYEGYGETGWRYAQNTSHLYRSLKAAYTPRPGNPAVPETSRVLYPSLGVMILKDRGTGLTLAIKGGHNGESHNHNDIGSFIVCRDDKPIFIDAGVGTYTRETFSGKRYTLWYMQSFYHNVPSFSGVAQQAGAQYAAKILEAGDDFIVFDLTNAYPQEAKLSRYTRRASMQNGVITLTDDIEFTEEGDAAFTLMCSEKPDLQKDRVTSGGLDAGFDPSLSPEAEEIPLTGTGLDRDWSRESLYRVRLNSGRFTERTFTMTIALHREF